MKVGDSIRIAKHRLTHVYDGREGKITIVENDPVTGHEYLFGTWGGISVCLEEGDEVEAISSLARKPTKLTIDDLLVIRDALCEGDTLEKIKAMISEHDEWERNMRK